MAGAMSSFPDVESTLGGRNAASNMRPLFAQEGPNDACCLRLRPLESLFFCPFSSTPFPSFPSALIHSTTSSKARLSQPAPRFACQPALHTRYSVYLDLEPSFPSTSRAPLISAQDLDASC
jgi:hypothetical protein